MEPPPQVISYQERERDSVLHCQIKQDFRVGKKAKTTNFLNLWGGGGQLGWLTHARGTGIPTSLL